MTLAISIYSVGAAGQVVALRVPEPNEVVIGNPLVSKDADNIIVDYDILLGEMVLSCNVNLEVSTNAGDTYSKISEGLTGDRKNIKTSGHKTIRIPLSKYKNKLVGKSLVFKLTVTDIPLPKDLSIKGTANCYIISNSGIYSIKAVKGNSSQAIEDIKSVVVLWETFGTDIAPKIGDLIKTISYSDGYITFKTADTFREGNALIAVKGTSGEILWSWHIWLTDIPQKCIYPNGAGTMMDRNLGATSATPGDVGSLGLLYQWGRKDPFLGSSNIHEYNKAKSTIYIWPTAVNSQSFNGTIRYGTIEYSVSHPTTFIYNNEGVGRDGNEDWYYTGDYNADKTRWPESNKPKSIYDPCPAGWRVPDGDWTEHTKPIKYGIWTKAGFKDKIEFDYKNRGILFKISSTLTTWYPASGLGVSDGVYSVGYAGWWWSATPQNYGGNRGECLFMSLNNNGSVYMGCETKDTAISVRCIKE